MCSPSFMERILCVMNSIKLTQQTHTQLLVELRTNVELPGCIADLGTLVDCDGSVAENIKQATLKDIEKAGMSWFRHATERAAGEDTALAATRSPTAGDAGAD
ncbi:uncharacterized protein LOC115319979 [Ixodes scapularis]|uniref:uncharacterized protein LOC115319979 n=1 Tax=Ixodes scapularis TaxID=6945 RepID=UPI001A9CCC5C|nr:uncharacterized protein LOC115319979 [Ixodes scapularis]